MLVTRYIWNYSLRTRIIAKDLQADRRRSACSDLMLMSVIKDT